MKKNNLEKKIPTEERELDEIWWIDYMEGELQEELARKDCQSLILRSPYHKKMVRELNNIRNYIKKNGEESLPTDPHYYVSFLSRVMNSLDEEEQEKARTESSL